MIEGNSQGTAEGAELEAYGAWRNQQYNPIPLQAWMAGVAWQQSRAQQAAPAQVAGEACRPYTKQRPTTEGWYWMHAHFMDETILHTTEIAKIFRQVPQAINDPDVEFSGPIPQPPATPDHEGEK